MLTLNAIRSMRLGDELKEQVGDDSITVCRVKAGWIVRRGIGGVSLARSPERAMFYVKQRRNAS